MKQIRQRTCGFDNNLQTSIDLSATIWSSEWFDAWLIFLQENEIGGKRYLGRHVVHEDERYWMVTRSINSKPYKYYIRGRWDTLQSDSISK